jgi:hypothetical protein
VVYDAAAAAPAAGLTFTVLEDVVTPVPLGGLTASGANIPAAVMGPVGTSKHCPPHHRTHLNLRFLFRFLFRFLIKAFHFL